MRKFDFGRGNRTISTISVIKFVVGWHLFGYVFYKGFWKPAVQKEAKEKGIEWDTLTSSEKYSLFQGDHNADTPLKQKVAKVIFHPKPEIKKGAAHCKDGDAENKPTANSIPDKSSQSNPAETNPKEKAEKS